MKKQTKDASPTGNIKNNIYKGPELQRVMTSKSPNVSKSSLGVNQVQLNKVYSYINSS